MARPDPEESLAERLRSQIRLSGPLPFSIFMERALYEPDLGYYETGESRIGREGDFVTASDVGRFLGECLLHQALEVDRLLDQPDPFLWTEFGGGRGLLARDVLDAAAGQGVLEGRLRYRCVERGQGMREAIRRHAPEVACHDPAEKLEPGDGVVVAVELFDALPVRRMRRVQGAIRELRVAVDGDRFVEEITEADQGMLDHAERYGLCAEEGFEAEWAEGLPRQLSRLAGSIDRGLIVVIDYGDSAERLARRPAGTAMAYRKQQAHPRVLECVGEQDLTAHVNFSAIEEAAREIGLAVLGRTTQDRFLIGNGILRPFDSATNPEGWSDPARVKQRLQAMQLIHPDGMGRAFQVLLLGRGLPPDHTLAGLVDPFADEQRHGR